jgi:hypothetical protein
MKSNYVEIPSSDPINRRRGALSVIATRFEREKMNRLVCCCFLLIFTMASPSLSSAKQKEKSGNKTTSLYERKSDKERIYSIQYDNLWDTCVQIAKDSFNVTFIDRSEGILNFELGQKVTSNPFRYGVSLSKADDEKTRIVVNVQNKGWGGLLSGSQRNKRTREFFDSLDKGLGKK